MVQSIDLLSANTIRTLAMDGVQKAKSGHPGMPMGVADVAYVLWTRFLKHNPADPCWPNRDRFILSAGHGSMLLYSLLHLTGYELSLDDLKHFRQWGSKTPGHPEHKHPLGVDTTTGPLGQGFANAVGMAVAERALAERFNRPNFPIVDHYTYVIAGDGDLMEGITYEAASLAGHFKLAKLIVLYDSNGISIDGPTNLTFTEDVGKRFEACGWDVQTIDGHNLTAVEQALQKAKDQKEKPQFIICQTKIGYGSPSKEGKAASHGEPLGVEEVEKTKEKLGWPTKEAFYIPQEVSKHMRQSGQKQDLPVWQELMTQYRQAHPDLAQVWDAMWQRTTPTDWAAVLPQFNAQEHEKGLATRVASGKIINALAPLVPSLLAGSADLTDSNKTRIEGGGVFQATSLMGRNIHYGVREHGMAGIMNGLALHGGFIPFGGTFLVFSDYMRPSIRMAALMGLQTIYVFTHDSIGLGEDGPTHQPIEQIPSLRLLPNLHVIRPADANETAQAWRMALERKNGPTALILTRQAVPLLTNPSAEGTLKGGYTVSASPDPKVLLLATGSEVYLALEAAKLLAQEGIAANVVSLPCWECFEAQDQGYKDSVLLPTVKARVAIEAAVTCGWEKYVGSQGQVIGIDKFGASAPSERLFEEYGLTVEKLVEKAKEVVAHVKD